MSNPWAPTLLLEQSSGDQSYPAFFVPAAIYMYVSTVYYTYADRQAGRVLVHATVPYADHRIDTFPGHAARRSPACP